MPPRANFSDQHPADTIAWQKLQKIFLPSVDPFCCARNAPIPYGLPWAGAGDTRIGKGDELAVHVRAQLRVQVVNVEEQASDRADVTLLEALSIKTLEAIITKKKTESIRTLIKSVLLTGEFRDADVIDNRSSRRASESKIMTLSARATIWRSIDYY